MHAMVVDAANEDAKRFYEGFGFVPLSGMSMRLFLPPGHAALGGSTGQAGLARAATGLAGQQFISYNVRYLC